MYEIADDICAVAFDSQTGGLRGIANRVLGDECLKGASPGGMPFRVYADLKEEFVIGLNDECQLVFQDPAAMCGMLVQPDTCRMSTASDGNGLALAYDADGLAVKLRVVPTEEQGATDWSLRVTNTGTAARSFLVNFPCLDGVRLGPDPEANLATAMDQGGLVVPAWERPGGVLGESNQMSMQWHAVWDPVSRSALAIIFMDAEVHPKRIELAEANTSLHHFPPVTLAPGESIELPPARVIVYQGDWRPAARAYRRWYDGAYPKVEPPEWFRRSNGSNGIHFRKGTPDSPFSYGTRRVIESFRDLASIHLSTPIDDLEYAFYSHKCMLPNVHTDGDHIVREDLGGPEGMREGIAEVHRLGMHVTLYVEGFIVSEESDLMKEGKVHRWEVVNRDGTRRGPYSEQSFHHMCVGCVEWQDHLAESVGRLLRQTGADAIRLDSLGFYYLPCYNPEHHHETPFGYNEWIKALLQKVRKAAIEARPDVLLLTEGCADWFGQYFHGALTSRCPRDLSMMRIAVGPFRTYVYASGALWGSLSGFPGGGCSGALGTPDWNWLCARYPVHEALVWGDVPDEDPRASDPEIVARLFEGDRYCAVVVARPACQDPHWPRGTTISDKRGEYLITVPGMVGTVQQAFLCDVETLEWRPLPIESNKDDLCFRLRTNWGLVVLSLPGGPGVLDFDPLPKVRPGDSTTVMPRVVGQGRDQEAESPACRVEAPGLEVTQETGSRAGEFTVTVPPDAREGHYTVYASGEGMLGTRRFLTVESA